MTRMAPQINVLVVDDSAMVRKVLSIGLESDPRIKVIGAAASAATARQMITELKPDVVTLDIEMPHVDGLTFLRELMAWQPIPVIIITSLSRSNADVTLKAMEAGAVDVIEKPSNSIDSGLKPIMIDVCSRIYSAASARILRAPDGETSLKPKASIPRPAWPSAGGQRLMAIGSSTGGVQALSLILPMFPADTPAILIVQHMPEGFTASFAKRLNSLCKMEVHEAKDGELIQDGTILVAPGGQRHMSVQRSGQLYRVELREGPSVNYSCPSVDVLFFSLAKMAGQNTSAAILTGMGKDGADGLLAIRNAGGATFAQDEQTSVVYGMPSAAAQLGAARQIAALGAIPALMLNGNARAPVGAAGPSHFERLQQDYKNPPHSVPSWVTRG